MKKSKITFVIFTYNEEKRIEKVIKNFKDYGKILISDNNSTDKTQEIAKRYNCDILLRTKDYAYVENQELVDQIYSAVDTDWIYWAFADEMLEKQTLEKITHVVNTGKFEIISMDRKNYFYGIYCNDLYHARTYKLFKKHAIDFIDNPIHSMGKPTVAVEKIHDLSEKYFIHHFISNTASSYLNVINRYTETEKEQYSSYKASFVSMLFMTFKVFLRDFLHSKRYKNGFSGIALTQLMLTYIHLKNIKLFEKANNLNSENIEDKNNTIRERIMQDFIN